VIGLATRRRLDVKVRCMVSVIIGGMATTIGTRPISHCVDRKRHGRPADQAFEFTPLVVDQPCCARLSLAGRAAPLREVRVRSRRSRRSDSTPCCTSGRYFARGRTVNSVRRMTGNRTAIQRVLRRDQTLPRPRSEVTGVTGCSSAAPAYLKDYERSSAPLYDARRVGGLPEQD
jgi:hypothetical protein